MVAELLFVGTELLLGQILNTNAAFLSQQLAAAGISVYRQTVVGDNPGRVAAAVRDALGRADVLITSGGLGPTTDDLTKEVIAGVLGRKLVTDPASLAAIESFFSMRHRRMTANNVKQAMIPEGGMALPNKRGTAPGVYVEDAGCVVAMLPGPPHELEPMFVEQVLPLLLRRQGRAQTIVSRVLHLCGIGESEVETRVADLIDAQEAVTIAPLASLGEVRLRLTCLAESREAGLAAIAPVEKAIRDRVGAHVFGVDGRTLPAAVVDLLKEGHLHLALAESCTGGLLGDMLTDVPGASEAFLLGVAAYSNRAKTEVLGVPEGLIAGHGAVSEEVCAAMAAGARELAHADLALAITGIAGPGGGSAEKPVGLVYIGLASGDGRSPTVERHCFIGGRQIVKTRAARQALVILREHVLSRSAKTQ